MPRTQKGCHEPEKVEKHWSSCWYSRQSISQELNTANNEGKLYLVLKSQHKSRFVGITFFQIMIFCHEYTQNKKTSRFHFLVQIEEGYFEYSNFEFKNGNFEKQSGELKLNTYPVYISNKFPTIWQNLIGC